MEEKSNGSKTLKGLNIVLRLCAVMLLVLAVYLYLDSQVSTSQLIEYRESSEKSSISQKEVFSAAFQKKYVEDLTAVGSSGEGSKWVGDVNVDSKLFNPTQIRLNTEIYEIAASVFNPDHLEKCYGKDKTKLAASYRKYANPLIPIALTLNESGSWKDTRYTWSAAIYSAPLGKNGMDMDHASISKIDMNTYISLNLADYVNCGNNCTASSDIGTKHKHVGGGKNDNDSLGSLQSLRRYLEDTGGSKKYNCGNVTFDLMRWDDSLEFFFHAQGNAYGIANSWCSGEEIQNEYQLVALIGASHNTGPAFISSTSGNGQVSSSSLWNSKKAVFDYCKAISTESNLKLLQAYTDKWYTNVAVKQANKDYSLAGEVEWSSKELSDLVNSMGINKSQYASSFKHKQYYPVKAILNYMAIEKLYLSGGTK